MIVVDEVDALYARALLRYLRHIGYTARRIQDIRYDPTELRKARVVIVDDSCGRPLPLELRRRPKIMMTSTGVAHALDRDTWVLPKPFRGQELEFALESLSRATAPDIGPEFHSVSRPSVRPASGSSGQPDAGSQPASSIESSQRHQ